MEQSLSLEAYICSAVHEITRHFTGPQPDLHPHYLRFVLILSSIYTHLLSGVFQISSQSSIHGYTNIHTPNQNTDGVVMLSRVSPPHFLCCWRWEIFITSITCLFNDICYVPGVSVTSAAVFMFYLSPRYFLVVIAMLSACPLIARSKLKYIKVSVRAINI